MKDVLLIAHTPSGNLEKIAGAIEEAIADLIRENALELRLQRSNPKDLDWPRLAKADGIIFLTPENFGYMSGALKDLFDRVYIDLLDKHQGKPYLLIVRAGSDGTGTVQAVESILTGLRWRATNEAVVLQGDFDTSFPAGAAEFAAAFAAGLEQGIF